MVEPVRQDYRNAGNADTVAALGVLIVLATFIAAALRAVRPVYGLIAVLGLAAFAITLHDGLGEWRGFIGSSSRGMLFPADGQASFALWLTLACSFLVSLCGAGLFGIGKGVSVDQKTHQAHL
jgi:hypothetical protein